MKSKRESQRISRESDSTSALRDYARIGAALMDLHINYEQQPEYDLQRTETGQLNWRVEKMSLSNDKTQLKDNGFLTLSGIPPQVYDYRLGNRSALEWVPKSIIAQYRQSPPTPAPASSTTPTARTTPNTSCASSARWSQSRWRRSSWSRTSPS